LNPILFLFYSGHFVRHTGQFYGFEEKIKYLKKAQETYASETRDKNSHYCLRKYYIENEAELTRTVPL
jgi:hypothetical protein